MALPKRKICFPITSRAYYGRMRALLQVLHDRRGIDMQLIAGASTLIDKYSKDLWRDIEQSGFSVHERLFNLVDGGNHIAMAKSASLLALDMANSLQRLNPDIVVINGDRFEQLAIAMTAAYLNKTIAHIEGGDRSGSIDESVRHAITKLAHIHFVTNNDSRKRVIQMGENPRYVFNVGSLDIESVAKSSKKINADYIDQHGVGGSIDLAKPFLMVIHHPVTTDHDNKKHVEETLHAVLAVKMPTIWFWPNPDAGTSEIAESIRHFREQHALDAKNFRFITNLPTDEFSALLRRTACLVGNSSAGIKECSFFGVPAVNIGERQAGRLRAQNVIDVGYDAQAIRRAIGRQIKRGPYPFSALYYKPDTSKKIAEILATVPLHIQKKFYESKYTA